MKLFLIAKNNIKKNKSMFLTLTALIAFASALLYVGASVILSMNTYLDDKNKELNGSDFAVFARQNYDEDIQKDLEEMGNYTQYEKVAAIIGSSTFTNTELDDKGQSIGGIIMNADSGEKISKLKIAGKRGKKVSNSIILPYYMKVAKGYKIGDRITISFAGSDHNFVVYGFAEDIMFATPSNLTYYKCYVFGDEFKKLYDSNINLRYSLVKIKLKKGVDSALYNDNFTDKLPEAASTITSMDLTSAKTGVSIFLIIIMTVLIAIAVIIILIALTVIRFAIETYIEGNMKNIGSMEALGYTGKELIFSTMLQFVTIAAAGFTAGLAASVLCAGIVTNLASSAIGLVWNSKWNPIAFVIDIGIIMFSVIAITYLTAAKLKKITPITALREGINTHSFKKNHFPFYKTFLPVNMAAGFKTLMLNAKQNMMMLIIIGLMTFVSVFAFMTNYNFNINNVTLLKLIGLENSHILVTYGEKDAQRIFNEIGQMEHVKKTIELSTIKMKICMAGRELTPAVTVSNEYDKLRIKTIVEGRYPEHDNEIAVTGLVMKQLKAKLGNVVTLKSNGSSQDFIIVGMSQQINNLGKGASLTEEGMKRINPEFVQSDLNVYLDNTENVPDVMHAIENKYRGKTIIVYNMEESFKEIFASFGSAMKKCCTACIILTMLIITLILYLLVKIRLIKERVPIGINKALGFTTGQIIVQITAGLCPVCILGAFLGTILAAWFINPIFTVMLSYDGIRNCHLVIDPVLTLIIFLAVSLYSILLTVLVAGAARRITPKELFL